MGAHDALKKARDFIRFQGGEVAPLAISEEELNPEAQDDLTLQAYALEPTVTCYEVDYEYPEDTDHSEFSFFQDGKQRTIHIGFIPAKYGSHHALIPVHYFVVAAVILRRSNQRLKVWTDPTLQQGVLIEKSLVPDQSLLQEYENAGLLVVDTECEGGDYYRLRNHALQKAKSLRLSVEDELIGEWRTSSEAEDHFLVVDGTLMNFRDEQNVRRCVGVSKSFGSRYFSISENNRIMQMGEFERSWTFRFHKPEEDLRKGARERVSWYLRLRSRPNTAPEFGLIRVEISRAYSDRAPEFADRFSKSLLSERLPTSYPAPRWDNHLYPIRECENYLSSIMPSIGTITASMKGVLP
jgi:hypothetical protein